MVKKKNTIFISFSSKDIGDEYVNAVESAIHDIGGYEADHMNKGVKDSSVNQKKLDERIMRSRLVIMVLGQQYKDCKNLRHEFEEVTKRGKTVLIFIKKYHTPEEEQVQKENIFSVLNIDENRYNRFEDSKGLRKDVENQLNRWARKEIARRKILDKTLKIILVVLAVAVLAVCFWWTVHYKIPHLENPFGKNADTIIVDLVSATELVTISDPVPPPKPEPPVVVPNTFSVVCDDELLSAGISDAVSKVLPSLSQYADTSKALWAISVKRDTVQEIPKIMDSDALQVEVYYTVDIINKANNKKSGRTIINRGRSIIQNRDGAIKNANEEAAKEIANKLKSMQQ